MPGNRKSSLRRGVVPQNNHAWTNDIHDVSPASSFGGISPFAPNMPRPVHDVQFQPSEICPQNYVIFDESENQSRVMFHPAIAQNLSYPHLEFSETSNRKITEENCGEDYEGANNAPPAIEDSDYIDLLLSLDEEDEGSDEEQVSTARTENYDGCSSPESCCNYASKSRKLKYPSSIRRSSMGGSSHDSNKKKEARRMIKSLRGMVPGGDQMNTAGVFDAAVRYLNGLEDKVQKLGLNNFKHTP